MDRGERSSSSTTTLSSLSSRPSASPLTRPTMPESSSSGASSTFSTYKPPSPSPLTPPLPNQHHLNATTSGGLPASVLIPAPIGSGIPPFASSSVAAAPIVHFDPNASDDDDDDEDGGSGRPKKKRRPDLLPSAGNTSAPGSAAGDLDDDPEKGRRKIDIAYIQKKEKRHITFSKRKAGIMKKAYELATLTGTQVLLLVVSETGIVYTFTTAKFQPLVGAGPGGAPSDGQRLIQACLAVDPSEGSEYISPPPDGPLLPLPPSAINRPFEANSAIHGGQIALRTRAHRPGATQRTKPRPAAIRTQSSGSSGGGGISQALPTPANDHQSMLLSPASAGGRNMHSMQQQQQQQQQQHHSPGDYSPIPSVLQGSVGPRGEPLQSAQDYQEMMQRPGPGQMGNIYQGGGPGGHLPPPGGPRIDPRLEQQYQQQQAEYGMPPQHGPPHPLHQQHHPQVSPDRYQNQSPAQHSPQHQQHMQQQRPEMVGNPNDHRRHYSEDGRGPPPQQRAMYDDPNHERGPPPGNMYPSQQAAAYHHSQMSQEEYNMMHQPQQRR